MKQCFRILAKFVQVHILLGKCIRTGHHLPAGVNYQWAPKGLYCTEQMLFMIKALPKR